MASIPSRVTGFAGRIWFHFLHEHWPRLCAFNTPPPGRPVSSALSPRFAEKPCSLTRVLSFWSLHASPQTRGGEGHWDVYNVIHGPYKAIHLKSSQTSH